MTANRNAVAFVFLVTVGWTPRAQAQAGTGEKGAREPTPANKTQPASQPTLAKPPKLIKRVDPRLPEGVAFSSEIVSVVLAIQISDKGLVVDPKVVDGAGEPFDSSALSAIRQFVFSPAVLSDGSNVPVDVRYTIRFQKPAAPKPTKVIATPKAVRFVGRLLERGTRKPLVGVELQALVKQRVVASAVSDGTGSFSLEVKSLRFLLRGTPAAHEPFRVEVTAKAGEIREETLYLEEKSGRYVTYVRSTRVKREVTRRVIPKAVVEKIPGTAGDALKVVQIMPGVARGSFDAGVIVLRGSSPQDSRILLDGHEIPLLFHFGGLRSTVNSVFLREIDFIPGNFGSEYGRATGGVVNVELRDPAHDLFRGQVDVNLYDAGFALEGPLSKNWSVGGAFRRSYIDAILPAVLPEDGDFSFQTLPRYYDYQLLAAWRPDKRRHLRITVFGSLDRLAAAFKNPTADPTIRGDARAQIMFHGVVARYQHRFSDTLSQDSSVQFAYQEIKTAFGPELFFNLGVFRLSARSAWDLQLSKQLALKVGLDVVGQWVKIDLNSPLRPLEGEDLPPFATQTFVRLERRSTLVDPAMFSELRFSPHANLDFFFGFRLDWFPEIGRVSIDPRLSLRWRPFEGTTLKFGFGSYHQPPSADQSDSEGGNPDLMAASSLQLSGGLEQTVVEGLSLELTGYYKWLDHLVIRNPSYYYDPSQTPYVTGGTGRIFGLELLLRARIQRFNGWLSYTYQRSIRKDGFTASERPFDYDQPHILSLVGSYEIGAGWSVGLRFRLVSGSPETPVVDSIYDTNSGTYVPIFGSANSGRQPMFHQLDLRIDKAFTFEKWKLTAYLDLQNVYNRRNPEGSSYSFDYRQNGTVSGTPIFPVLGLKGEW